MPYKQMINSTGGIGSTTEKVNFIRELDFLRTELNDIRSAVSAIRALLVAATAVGAGYNVASTNLGPAITATPNQLPVFTPT